MTESNRSENQNRVDLIRILSGSYRYRKYGILQDALVNNKGSLFGSYTNLIRAVT